jgi:hypothetical protein
MEISVSKTVHCHDYLGVWSDGLSLFLKLKFVEVGSTRHAIAESILSVWDPMRWILEFQMAGRAILRQLGGLMNQEDVPAPVQKKLSG